MIQGSLSISLQGVKAAALPIDARKSTVLRSNASEHAKNARVLKHSGRLGKVALHKKAAAAKPPVSGATSPFLAALLLTNATQQTPVRTAQRVWEMRTASCARRQELAQSRFSQRSRIPLNSTLSRERRQECRLIRVRF
ncbi:hypothetical protein [Ferroacidibacillus organovorans]|uniref:Uncharacterized protein n=1 Tax=Ferroacidibacillus organovorans TaxID=1765683 RepID=A0A853KGD1_9BACL|nr:hypothetical protein [Ferroacidibacillus organovorans]KYP82157.1 hypothetical protein AYJ22_00445 [Ferroacidibacillus organovorans]OAG94440.1 hypothetical protein AYW79_05335 [Ferroacidibacillus organovorans]